jgi:hypothetical protein
VLALSHLYERDSTNVSFCAGIKANSGNYFFIDYPDLYLELGKKRFEERIESLVIEKKINYIFFVFLADDLTFDIHFIERLSRLSFVVMIFFDTEHYFESVDRYYAQAADLVFSGYSSKCRYGLYNINAAPLFGFFDKNKYQVLKNRNKCIDVSFVGLINKANRRNYIDYLRANKITVDLYGGGTRNGFIDFSKMVEILNNSKINLNFCGLDTRKAIHTLNINNRITQINGRLFEIALCGGFVLTEYMPGIENMFEIGKEMDCFRSKEELLEKIKYYLKNEKEREDIAKRGYERAIRDYDATVGFAKIFDHIKEIKREEKIIYLDDEFMRNYATYRFLYITRFLITFKIKNLLQELKIVLKFRKLNLYNAYYYFINEVLISLNAYISKFPSLKRKIKNGLGYLNISFEK